MLCWLNINSPQTSLKEPQLGL
jgi:hypothetical protein